ncbi:HAD family hydrolase [Salinicoccus hispanicus]|uniref:HAD-IB family hydrolase n=1 Tax=Salinicoccus hispanicus TaxID=157225 RepID=A0A6N8U334_9STAP|nr:HAD-IB family hydrolase [Salinicoccus hispanicus]MXQ51697.1 HAD-IB family hydrolase [Salinicoccus hispanicus]
MKVALFDFDGTLYPYETFNVLMERLKRHPRYKKNYSRFVRRFAPVYFAYKMKMIKKSRMQSKAMEYYLLSFKKNTRSEIEAFFKEVAGEMIEDLRAPLIGKMKQLKQENYYIMLISGAFIPLLEAVFKGFDIDCIVGSEIRYKGEKIDYKSRFERVYADRKIDIIRRHFADKQVDWKNSEAYSDSYTDLKMLELVGRPVAVKPDERLKAVAARNQWQIHTD